MKKKCIIFSLSDSHNNEQNKTKLLKNIVYCESFYKIYNYTSKVNKLKKT